ncbi:hypothetical protein OH787_40860 (plasmid) [Streptomyces sp. NBC_01547]
MRTTLFHTAPGAPPDDAWHSRAHHDVEHPMFYPHAMSTFFRIVRTD